MNPAGYVLAMLLGVATVAGTASSTVPPRLIYNASASAPIGWYRVSLGNAWAVGDLVVARLPRSIRETAAARDYLPDGVPVLKHVVATAGATACVRDGSVWIDDRSVSSVALRDGAGRSLTPWPGCRRLVAGEVFLLNSGATSYDSRYFGPIDESFIVGVAEPLSIQ